MFLKSTDLKIMLQYLQESSLSEAVFLIWKCAPQKCFLDNVRYVQASYFKSISYKCLTLFKMGLFGAAHGWGAKKAPLPKICHTYPAIMKLGTVIPYLKKTQKNIWIMWHTLWVLLTSAFFHRKSANFAILENTAIDCILVHNF